MVKMRIWLGRASLEIREAASSPLIPGMVTSSRMIEGFTAGSFDSFGPVGGLSRDFPTRASSADDGANSFAQYLVIVDDKNTDLHVKRTFLNS